MATSAIAIIQPIEDLGLPGNLYPEAGGWYTYYHKGRQAEPDNFGHLRLMATTGAGHMYLVFGSQELIDIVEDRSVFKFRNLAAVRGAPGSTLNAFRNSWREERLFNRDGSRIGNKVSLHGTMGGFDYISEAER